LRFFGGTVKITTISSEFHYAFGNSSEYHTTFGGDEKTSPSKTK
jgi:hypothetical protein